MDDNKDIGELALEVPNKKKTRGHIRSVLSVSAKKLLMLKKTMLSELLYYLLYHYGHQKRPLFSAPLLS